MRRWKMKIDDVELKFNKDGNLYVSEQGQEPVRVRVQKCFPWSYGDQYFSLRDSSENEMLLIKNFSDLDYKSVQALKMAIEISGFCFVVDNLIAVEEDFELRIWKVICQQGERVFQTKLMDWPRELPGGGLLIQDVAGDVYFIPAVEKLPEPGKSLLWAFLD